MVIARFHDSRDQLGAVMRSSNSWRFGLGKRVSSAIRLIGVAVELHRWNSFIEDIEYAGRILIDPDLAKEPVGKP
jgi:hypothetical protein